MKLNLLLNTLAISSLAIFSGCSVKSMVMNEAGKKSVYESVDTASKDTQGIGIESQDIVGMVDNMMRDIISTGFIVNKQVPPRVIIDSKYFKNQSSSRINKSMITDRLLVHLNRAAKGRIIFIEREEIEMVTDERELKREGHVSIGNLGNVKKVYGADYRLAGKIMSLDTLNNKSGMESRYHQITFKLVDLESSAVVWSNMYEFKKSSAANIIYR